MSYGIGPHDYDCDCWRCQSRRKTFAVECTAPAPQPDKISELATKYVNKAADHDGFPNISVDVSWLHGCFQGMALELLAAPPQVTPTSAAPAPQPASEQKAIMDYDVRPFSQMPEDQAAHVAQWLRSNKKKAAEVRWSLYPIGMVGRWIERAICAEATPQVTPTLKFVLQKPDEMIGLLNDLGANWSVLRNSKYFIKGKKESMGTYWQAFDKCMGEVFQLAVALMKMRQESTSEQAPQVTPTLKEILKQYGAHHIRDCDALNKWTKLPCDCGFAALIEGTSEQASPTPEEKTAKLAELKQAYDCGNLGWSEAVQLYWTWQNLEARRG